MAAGHILADIKGYTRRQLVLFSKYAAKAARYKHAEHLDDLCVAFTGKPHPHAEKLRQG